MNVTMPASFTTGIVCVNSSNSCGTSPDRCVSVKGAPNTPGVITANPTSWCNGASSIKFTADTIGVMGAFTYSWKIVPATAATIQSLQGGSTIVNWNTGNAVVSLTAQNSCGSGTRTYNAIISCRETGDIVSANDLYINVYPNPSNHILNVRLNSEQNSQYNMQFVDVTGKVIYREKINAIEGMNDYKVDVKKFAKGIYLLRISSPETMYSLKVQVN